MADRSNDEEPSPQFVPLTRQAGWGAYKTQSGPAPAPDAWENRAKHGPAPAAFGNRTTAGLNCALPDQGRKLPLRLEHADGGLNLAARGM